MSRALSSAELTAIAREFRRLADEFASKARQRKQEERESEEELRRELAAGFREGWVQVPHE